MRYASFFSYEWQDQAVRNQMFWNLVHGRIFSQSLQRFPLPDHFEPMDFVIVPFYAIYPRIYTLFFCVSAALASGAIAVYLLCLRLFRQRSAGLLFAAAYLAFGPLHYVNVATYKTVMLSVPCMLFAFHFFHARRFHAFVFFAMLALGCRENISLAIFMFGVYALLMRMERRWAIAPFVMGAVWFVLSVKIVTPYISTGQYWHVGKLLGSKGFVDLAFKLVHQPGVLAWALFNREQIQFYSDLLKPAHFLCLLSPEMLPALPSILNVCLKNVAYHRGGLPNNAAHSIAPAIPFIVIGTIFACHRISRWVSRRWGKAEWPVLLAAVIFLLNVYQNFGDNIPGRQDFLGDLPVQDRRFLDARSIYDRRFYETEERDRVAWEMIAKVPSDAVVSATGDLLPALSHRRYLLEFGQSDYNFFNAEYFLLNTENLYNGSGKYNWLFTENELNCPAMEKLIQAMLSTGKYELLAHEGTFWLLRAKGRRNVSVNP